MHKQPSYVQTIWHINMIGNTSLHSHAALPCGWSWFDQQKAKNIIIKSCFMAECTMPHFQLFCSKGFKSAAYDHVMGSWNWTKNPKKNEFERRALCIGCMRKWLDHSVTTSSCPNHIWDADPQHCELEKSIHCDWLHLILAILLITPMFSAIAKSTIRAFNVNTGSWIPSLH